MKKNNRVLRIGLLALVLTLVTASLVSGTFAKYVTTVKGTGTVSVADWKVSLTATDGKKDGYSSDVAFDLFDKIDAGILNSKLIAPGSGNTYSFSYDTSNTEVDHKVSLVLKSNNNLTTIRHLVLKLNGTPLTPEQLTALSSTAGLVLANEPVIQAGEGTQVDYDLSWEWPFEKATNDNGNDSVDTEDGMKGIENVKFDLIFSAEQLDAA